MREGDLAVFFEHQLDPAANRLAAFTPRDREAFAEHWAGILADASILKKTVLCDGQVVGNVVCFERSGLREVGYWIGREHWGRGIATRALGALLREIGTRPLYARVARHNLPSIRVLEKCGFRITELQPAPTEARGPEVEELLLELRAAGAAGES